MSITSHTNSAEEDLAFLRSIVEGDGKSLKKNGVVFLAGGLLYGLLCLFGLSELIGVVQWPDPVYLIVIIVLNVAFFAVLGWALRPDRRAGTSGSTANRALNAAFAGAGLANLAMVIVFGVSAVLSDDFGIWLFYPAVVFAILGAAWFVEWRIRRKPGSGAVAFGWLLTSVALGLLRHDELVYVTICTIALFLLMALPGAIMIRTARRANENGG